MDSDQRGHYDFGYCFSELWGSTLKSFYHTNIWEKSSCITVKKAVTVCYFAVCDIVIYIVRQF